MKLYERTEIYDLFENEGRFAAIRKHWETLLAGKNVHSLLDVSIGTGNTTLPLLEMGMELYGSDLNPAMLERCGEKAQARGYGIDLRQCDFRELTKHFDRQFDCVASTGNSLAYVPNDEILSVLEQMDALIAPGGWLYFDLRNWDKIANTKQRFYTYDPAFDGDTRINLVQAWDHNPDGSMDFNLLYTFERGNHIVQREDFCEHYYPVPQKLLVDKLQDMGYTDIEIYLYPAQFGKFINRADWYCLIARK